MRPLRLPHRSTRSLRFSLADGLPRCFPCFACRSRGKPGPCTWTLVNRCRPYPVFRGRDVALPAFQETPMCLCPALRSRSSLHPLGLRPRRGTSYYGCVDVVPPGKNRKTRAIKRLSGFNYAAYALAPYASCAPRGNATQWSLPGGCQPFPGGTGYPLGFIYMFIHPFVCFLMYCLLARFAER